MEQYVYETPSALRIRAMHILQKELGPVDTVRFFQQYEYGEGDYTARRAVLNENETLEVIFSRIEAKRNGEH